MENKARYHFNWTLDYRRAGQDWPKPYRVRILPNKQERQEYKITAYGDTEEEAHANARALISQK